MSSLDREDAVLEYYSYMPQRSITDSSNNLNINTTAGRKPGRRKARGSTVTVRKKKNHH